MRVRLWLKSTRISVATCQKERIVRRYFSLHWGAGAMPRTETWHGHEERSASCNITIKALPTPRALTKRPYKKPHNHHSNTNINIAAPPSCVGASFQAPVMRTAHAKPTIQT